MPLPHSNTTIIDEATEQLAEYFGAILADDTIDQPAAMTKLFKQYGDYLKANVTDDDVTGDYEGDGKKLSERLKEVIASMIAASPGLHPQRAARWLLHTTAGRELLSTAKLNISKAEKEIPMVDVFKLHNIESVREIAKHITEKADVSEFDFTKILLGHAKLTKKSGESDGAAFERILTAPENGELRQAYQTTKGMATLTPTSTVVGSSLVADDSAEAVRQLAAMAESQGRKFEDVFADQLNSKLAAKTYTSSHRPNI